MPLSNGVLSMGSNDLLFTELWQLANAHTFALVTQVKIKKQRQAQIRP
jgi:hypothetical protein